MSERSLGEQIDRVRSKLAEYQAKHEGRQVWVLCGSDNPLWRSGIRNLDGAIFDADDSITLTDWQDSSKDVPLAGPLLYFTLTDPNGECDDDGLED